MTLTCALTRVTCCSSQNPISRSRCVTSGEAVSCLMRTEVPALTRLSGQSSRCSQELAEHAGTESFTRGRLGDLPACCKMDFGRPAYLRRRSVALVRFAGLGTFPSQQLRPVFHAKRDEMLLGNETADWLWQ